MLQRGKRKTLHCVILIMFHYTRCVQVPLQGQLCAGVRCLRAAHLHCPRLHPEPSHPAHHQQHRVTVRSAINTNSPLPYIYHSNKHYVLYDETLFPFPSNNFCLCRRVLSNNFSLCRRISPLITLDSLAIKPWPRWWWWGADGCLCDTRGSSPPCRKKYHDICLYLSSK